MIPENMLADGAWLPLVFGGLMGLAILIYVVLDGYDLGVGMLMTRASDQHKDMMIASIGPFWDANETWLVLGGGLLLVAFPIAHGTILTALYLPVALMLLGLILRGVSFDFRAKAGDDHKKRWDRTFAAGSLLASLAQGYMLGMYIMGFERTWPAVGFSLLAGACLASGYAFIGACWLIWRTEGELQRRSVKWAKRFLLWTALGLALVSIVTPLVNERIFEKWFQIPELMLLAPVPLAPGFLLLLLYFNLRRQPHGDGHHEWVPFAAAIGVFALAFVGLAYSFFPYVVPEKMTLWDAASAPESLMIILAGALFVLPCIMGYTVYSSWVFR